MSAQTDLAIHDEKGLRICNVEFKSKGVSIAADKHFPIYKDLQKLLREQVWGVWFHLLESVDNSTINKLLNVMTEQACKVLQNHRDDIDSRGLTIHICVLKHGFSIQRDLIIQNDIKFIPDEIRLLLRLGHSVSRSKLISVDDQNGWHLHTRNS
ncbi:hypothetical protein ACFL6N_06475 [Thermodesulfobacteriota bacterium]